MKESTPNQQVGRVRRLALTLEKSRKTAGNIQELGSTLPSLLFKTPQTPLKNTSTGLHN